MATCHTTLPKILTVVGELSAVDPLRVISKTVLSISFALLFILLLVSTLIARGFYYLVRHESLLNLLDYRIDSLGALGGISCNIGSRYVAKIRNGKHPDDFVVRIPRRRGLGYIADLRRYIIE